MTRRRGATRSVGDARVRTGSPRPLTRMADADEPKLDKPLTSGDAPVDPAAGKKRSGPS